VCVLSVYFFVVSDLDSIKCIVCVPFIITRVSCGTHEIRIIKRNDSSSFTIIFTS
jgi:hypothetical protein